MGETFFSACCFALGIFIRHGYCHDELLCHVELFCGQKYLKNVAQSKAEKNKKDHLKKIIIRQSQNKQFSICC